MLHACVNAVCVCGSLSMNLKPCLQRLGAPGIHLLLIPQHLCAKTHSLACSLWRCWRCKNSVPIFCYWGRGGDWDGVYVALAVLDFYVDHTGLEDICLNRIQCPGFSNQFLCTRWWWLTPLIPALRRQSGGWITLSMRPA